MDAVAVLFPHHLRIHLVHLQRYTLLCIVLQDALPPLRRQLRVECGIIQQPAHAGGQLLHIAFLEQQPGIVDDVRNLARTRADHGRLAGHSLDEHAPELFLPVGTCQRWQHKGVYLLHLLWHCIGWNCALESNSFSNTQSQRLLFQLVLDRAGTDKNHPAVVRQARERLDQQRQAFFLFQTPNVAQYEWRVPGARRAWLAALVNLRVDAVLRHDADWTAEALALQYIGSVGNTCHRDRRVTVIVLLHLAERWWVAAVDVLPGNKQHLRLVAPRQARGVKGREVVRLFIDMQDLRAYLAHDLAQAWVVIEMKMAIEHHRCDDRAIAPGVARLKNLLAAIIGQPVSRRDKSEFDARTKRQFFQFALCSARHKGFRDHQYAHSIIAIVSCSAQMPLRRRPRFLVRSCAS